MGRRLIIKDRAMNERMLLLLMVYVWTKLLLSTVNMNRWTFSLKGVTKSLETDAMFVYSLHVNCWNIVVKHDGNCCCFPGAWDSKNIIINAAALICPVFFVIVFIATMFFVELWKLIYMMTPADLWVRKTAIYFERRINTVIRCTLWWYCILCLCTCHILHEVPHFMHRTSEHIL